jgi:5-methylcytosine-specific restriction endonuclease McrA
VSETLFDLEPSIVKRRLPLRARAHRDRVMPLSHFPESKQAEIAEAVAQPRPPAQWIRVGLCQMQSRAWYEWHWQRGLDPTAIRPSLPKALREAVIARDGMVCGLCSGVVENRADIHIDHIVPVSRGGSDHLGNLQVSHSWCNLAKGARV